MTAAQRKSRSQQQWKKKGQKKVMAGGRKKAPQTNRSTRPENKERADRSHLTIQPPIAPIVNSKEKQSPLIVPPSPGAAIVKPSGPILASSSGFRMENISEHEAVQPYAPLAFAGRKRVSAPVVQAQPDVKPVTLAVAPQKQQKNLAPKKRSPREKPAPAGSLSVVAPAQFAGAKELASPGTPSIFRGAKPVLAASNDDFVMEAIPDTIPEKGYAPLAFVAPDYETQHKPKPQPQAQQRRNRGYSWDHAPPPELAKADAKPSTLSVVNESNSQKKKLSPKKSPQGKTSPASLKIVAPNRSVSPAAQPPASPGTPSIFRGAKPVLAASDDMFAMEEIPDTIPEKGYAPLAFRRAG